MSVFDAIRAWLRSRRKPDSGLPVLYGLAGEYKGAFVPFDGKPIGITPAPIIELTVVETQPEMRGATASNSPKPATLETGLKLNVPPFVKEGERIRVDTAFANGLTFWVAGDNLWKGAALNSIQIAEAMIREGISLRPSA